jgi:hypothetical protein
MKEVVNFICFRCDAPLIEDYTIVWEVEVRCLWCPDCEATFPLPQEEVKQ